MPVPPGFAGETMGKKDKEKKESKKQKNSAAVDERFKKALAIQPPEDNPYKMENEAKIDRFRYLYRTDWSSFKEQRRQVARHNRPKRPQNKFKF
jgi:hypothetical protein